MTTAKSKTKIETLKSIDWLDKGLRVFTVVATAYASGYISTIASEHRAMRRAKKLSSDTDSNVLMLDKKAANS